MWQTEEEPIILKENVDLFDTAVGIHMNKLGDRPNAMSNWAWCSSQGALSEHPRKNLEWR